MEALAARLGSTVDFAEAADLLHLAVGVRLGATTVRHHTYAAGEAAVVVEAAALAEAMQAPARAAHPPAVLQVSIDATKVPLVGGGWTDVKLAVFADLVPGAPTEAGLPTLHPQTVSYVGRWEPAAQFGQTITLEAQRRGIDEAAAVVSPNDGADWIQGNLDLIAPRAVRVLDFPHAVEHLAAVATLVYGEGATEALSWLAAQRKALHDEGPDGLLLALTACQARGPCAAALTDAAGRTPQERLRREVAYFASRTSQLAYPVFQQQGYPIGSGMVESGHKVLIGARCKGAGQHWASHHLNPLLVLRCASCNDRWQPVWAALWTQQSQHAQVTHAAAQQQRAQARLLARPPAPTAQAMPTAPPLAQPLDTPAPPTPPRPKRVVAGRPTAAHPWRKPFLVPRQAATR